MGRKRLDLVGKKFGKLLVMADTNNTTKWKNVLWLCKCDCGVEKVIRGGDLVSGRVKSCGCLRKEITSEMNKGKCRSEEVRRKISESNKGISRNKGKKHPELSGKNHHNYKHGLSKTKEYHKEYGKRWQKENKDKINAYIMRRRFAKLDQTPTDADMNKIIYIYKVCKLMNCLKDKKYEIDHIKPLSKGGLHHQDNLQILRADLNRRKNAKWPLTKEEKLEYKGITLKDLILGG